MALPIPDTAVCLGCRYLLRGLETPVCPECGRHFKPDDRRTYGDLLHRGICYRLTHPPRHWLRFVVIAWAAIAILAYTEFGSLLVLQSFSGRFSYAYDPKQDIATTVGLAVVATCCLIALQHIAMRRLTMRLKRVGAPPPLSKLMKWWWAPLCLALVLSTEVYPWPMWLRFQFSRSSLETVAKKQITIGTGTLDDSLCGAYFLDGVLVYSGPVALLTIKGSPGAGFIYSPAPDWRRDFAYPLTRHWSYTPRWGRWP